MKRWEKLPVKEQPNLYSNSSVVLHNDKILVFGGYYEVANLTVKDFHTFNMLTKEWSQISHNSQEIWPKMRMGHSAVVFGDYIGWNYECHSDIWRWSFSEETWENVEWEWASEPEEIERYYHQSVVYKNKIYILFGCLHSNHSRSDQVFEFDTDKKMISLVKALGDGPTGRSGTTCGIYNDTLYVFGGYGQGGHRHNDFYAFDLQTKYWKKLDPIGDIPPPTSGQSGAYFGGSFYLFGGSYGGNGNVYSSQDLTYTNGFYKFEFTGSRWKKIQSKNSPSERSYCSAFIYLDSLLLFGGSDKKRVFTDFYSWKLDFSGYGQKAHTTEQFCDVIVNICQE